MPDIAVIGDKDTISVFGLAGVDTFPTDNSDNVRQIFTEVYKKDYKIMLLTEDVFLECTSLIPKGDISPIIISIPNNKQNRNVGQKMLNKLSRIAIGSEIK